MKLNINTTVWLILVILTMLSAIVAGLNSGFVMLLVLVISALKFSAVAFYFMNLRKAHPFWKVAVLGFLLLFIIIVLIL